MRKENEAMKKKFAELFKSIDAQKKRSEQTLKEAREILDKHNSLRVHFRDGDWFSYHSDKGLHVMWTSLKVSEVGTVAQIKMSDEMVREMVTRLGKYLDVPLLESLIDELIAISSVRNKGGEL